MHLIFLGFSAAAPYSAVASGAHRYFRLRR